MTEKIEKPKGRPLPSDPYRRISLILYRAGVRKKERADEMHGPGFVVEGNITGKLASRLDGLGMRLTAIGPDHMLVREVDRITEIGSGIESTSPRPRKHPYRLLPPERLYATPPGARTEDGVEHPVKVTLSLDEPIE